MADTQKERLARVETKLDTIEHNHLVHMQQDINKIDKRLSFVVSGVALSVVLGFVEMFLGK